MKTFTIDSSKIAVHFDALGRIGNLGPALEDGFLRASWSKEETAAMEYVRGVAEKQGLLSRYDAIGNLFVRTGFEHKRVLQIGSHLDTVPRGGLFDGGAGIVAGLEAILAVWKSEQERLQMDLELVVWRGEEAGTYNQVFKGSKAAFGILRKEALAEEFRGQTLQQAIRGEGYETTSIEEGLATFTQTEIDSLAAHFELHIEQARKLEIDETDIGIVTSIRGNQRFRVFLRGESAHSGATPMGTLYRKDANLTMAFAQARLHELCIQEIEKGGDLVQTVGVVNSDRVLNEEFPEVYDNGLTKVSEFGYFLLDIRSRSRSFLDSYCAQAKRVLEDTAGEFGVGIEIQAISTSVPTESLDARLQDVVEEATAALGYSSQRLASGAGHDAAVVAAQQRSDGSSVPVSMIFIPCRDGISHNPLEFTTNEAVAKGADVLATAICSIATRE